MQMVQMQPNPIALQQSHHATILFKQAASSKPALGVAHVDCCTADCAPADLLAQAARVAQASGLHPGLVPAKRPALPGVCCWPPYLHCLHCGAFFNILHRFLSVAAMFTVQLVTWAAKQLAAVIDASQTCR